MASRIARCAAVVAITVMATLAGSLAARAEAGAAKVVAPPHAFIEFCYREPQECPSVAATTAASMGDGSRDARANYWRLVFTTDGPQAISEQKRPQASITAQDDGALAQIAKVNTAVNRSLSERSDQSMYGRQDFWALPLAHGAVSGDCEDFVLEKRRMLRTLGYTENQMSIAIVRTSWGEKHAVLLVATPQGEAVLDNLSSQVEPWSRTRYALVARQSAEDPSVWVSGR
jgi:predicted transglutaminase-like cysteine proteinase